MPISSLDPLGTLKTVHSIEENAKSRLKGVGDGYPASPVLNPNTLKFILIVSLHLSLFLLLIEATVLTILVDESTSYFPYPCSVFFPAGPLC
jgi:hypothetical protein